MWWKVKKIFHFKIRKNPKKERKNPKNRKRKKEKSKKKIEKGNPKNIKKFKTKKKKEKNQKRKEGLFFVVLDKMCIFCLYPILDSQQYVTRGSCRCPILSGLPCFLFWASNLFPLCVCLFYRIFESCHFVFISCLLFMFNCYLSCRFVSCHVS